MIRPSELLVAYLQYVEHMADWYHHVSYRGETVSEIEQVDYDKFVLRFERRHDEEIRCEGVSIVEFQNIATDFELSYREG